MKKITLLAVLLVLNACADVKEENSPPSATGDVLEGGVVKGTDTAVIAIGVESDGMPKVLVDPIIVTEGQRVVWAGPTDMTIRFPKTTPFEKQSLSTGDAVINAVVPRLETGEKQETFKYDIIVNGVTLDPVMIVRKQF